jgi:hypothetical protein
MIDDPRDSEFRDLLDQARQLPRSIEPPRDLWPGIQARIAAGGTARSGAMLRRRWARLAIAATLLLVIARSLIPHRTAGWQVDVLAGTPRLGTTPLAGRGAMAVGDAIETDASSAAMIQVGRIGRVEVKPGSRVRLLSARTDDHRLALDRGAIYAQVDAPPRLFFVETPSGTAVDLGCAYTLEVDSTGGSRLHVTAGYVEFQWSGRRSVVPLGAIALTRPGFAPGTPFTDDAPAALRNGVAAFDFGPGAGRARAVAVMLAAARSEDALTLWHLLSRVDPSQRALVYDRLVTLVPPPLPPGVTRAAALRLESGALDSYWEKIRRIAWRRVILRGVREIDPRTGHAR